MSNAMHKIKKPPIKGRRLPMKAILKTNTIITQKNKKPMLRTYLSIVDAWGLSFHVHYNTNK